MQGSVFLLLRLNKLFATASIDSASRSLVLKIEPMQATGVAATTALWFT
jgi:hypothetical protein